jgi:hypothetical protein
MPRRKKAHEKDQFLTHAEEEELVWSITRLTAWFQDTPLDMQLYEKCLMKSKKPVPLTVLEANIVRERESWFRQKS